MILLVEDRRKLTITRFIGRQGSNLFGIEHSATSYSLWSKSGVTPTRFLSSYFTTRLWCGLKDYKSLLDNSLLHPWLIIF